jgi:outer membrane lipoprotein-sorting protein
MKRCVKKTALIACLLLSAACGNAWAFDLQQLQQQLRAAPVVRGDFVQQRFLRALPQPLTSEGHFVLAADKGLLWDLRTPIPQTLRITPDAIVKRDAGGAWRPLTGRAGGGRENRLFMSVLSGDTSGLQENFAIVLTGEANDWHLSLTPTSALLKQIFEVIRIDGGALVDRVELAETQGDRSVLQMKNAHPAQSLDDQETRAFAN